MEVPLLIRLEILLLFILLWYVFWYAWYQALKSSRKLRKLLWIKKQPWSQEYKVKVHKSDESSVMEHSKNTKKLSSADKFKISELLKKIGILISKREFDLAKNMIIEGLTIDKFNTDLNLDLAKIYIEEDEYVKAEYIYKDLLLVHSEDLLILKRLWYVLSIQEKYEMAIEMYKKAYKLNKDDTEITNMLWQLTYYVEDYLWAIKYTKKFLKAKPKDIENMQILASSYEKTHNFNDSLWVYKDMYDLKPYDAEIQSHIQRLKQELK